MSTKYVLALDQGTTSSRAILFDNEQNIIAVQQREFEQIYPQQGWVEHNPMEIWSTQYGVMNEVVAQSGVDVHDIAAIGITNQRETTILWEKATGRPIYNAIVWQCRRTAPLVDELVQQPGMTESWITCPARGSGPRRARSCSAPWTPGWCGSSPAARCM